MCQCKLIKYNICTSLMWDVDIPGDCVGGDALGVYGNSLCFPLNFAINLNLL